MSAGKDTNTILTQLHEEPNRGRASRATVRPEDNIILVRVIPAFEEIEEQMSRLDVDVSSVGSSNMGSGLLDTVARDRHILT